jgi:hypothetical protein
MEKNYLIITPKNGLCNQLSSISIGIVLGLITNRDVIFKSFQLDYKYNDNTCKFDTIIDIQNLQKKLINNNIKIRIYSDFNIKGENININITEDIANIKDFIQYLFIENNKKIKYLNVGAPLSCIIPNEYKKILNFINLNIKFTDKYINIANIIKKKLKLEYYCCVHLRLEDDAIHFMKDMSNNMSFDDINKIYKEKYINELDILKSTNQKIYICTSLSINNNVNNDFYNYLKKNYNIVNKNDIIQINENNCREIYGIIDFIIAQDSLYFVGSDWSSFSIYIYSLHKNLNKDAKLLNIWNSIKK